MNHPYELEDLEDYDNGRMGEADRKVFEEELAVNKNLQKELEAVRAQAEIMTYLRKEALMEEMGKWGKEEGEPERRIVPFDGKAVLFNTRMIMAIAATLVILLVAYFLFRGNDKSPGFLENPTEHPVDSIKDMPENQLPPPVIETPDEEPVDKKDQKPNQPEHLLPKEANPKYRQYADAGIDRISSSLVSRERGGIDPNDTSHFEKALQFFLQKQYLQTVAMDGRGDERISYLQAISYFRLKKYSEAAKSFHSVSDNKSLGLDAQWGEAMSLVAMLPATCQELQGFLQSIRSSEYYEYHHYKKELDGLDEAIGLSTICPK